IAVAGAALVEAAQAAGDEQQHVLHVARRQRPGALEARGERLALEPALRDVGALRRHHCLEQRGQCRLLVAREDAGEGQEALQPARVACSFSVQYLEPEGSPIARRPVARALRPRAQPALDLELLETLAQLELTRLREPRAAAGLKARVRVRLGGDDRIAQ